MTLTTLKRDTTATEAPATLGPDFEGQLLSPGTAGFDEAATVWNGTVEERPGLIARCTSAGDVAATVRYAAENDVLLAVKGGGHNVAGTGTCDGGLMIDLSPMNRVRVDADARIAHADGGATWADLDAATQAHGVAAPGGLVSKTGIGGLTLCGGLGWLRRKAGMSCDALVSAEIVTADGTILTANETEQPDLFWAIRGGGGNFGVVTRFDYRVQPLGPEVFFSFVLYPLEDGRAVLTAWRDFCRDAPDEISSIVLCGTVPREEPFPGEIHGRDFAALATLYSGSVEEGEAALHPLGDLGVPLCDFSGPAPYVEVQKNFDGEYPDGLRYYWKSLYADALTDELINLVLALSKERPSALTTVDVWQLGGAMARVDADATAIGSREAPWLIGIESNWEYPADDRRNIAWTRRATERMAPLSTGEPYLNFEPDSRVAPGSGDAHRRRLAETKARYDPANLFRRNHNIAPANG